MMCAFGARRNPGFYAAQENLERGQHRVGCVGGDPGAAVGRRAAGGPAGVHGALRLHGADLSHRLFDLC